MNEVGEIKFDNTSFKPVAEVLFPAIKFTKVFVGSHWQKTINLNNCYLKERLGDHFKNFIEHQAFT